jgi:hypothetical protein
MVVLVLALGMAAHSPVLHEWFCDHDHAARVTATAQAAHSGCCGHAPVPESAPGPVPPVEDADGCVVDLFAQGFAPGVAALVLGAPVSLSSSASKAMPETVRPIAPRYTLRPLRGPPVA